MEDEQKYLEEKHNKGLILNDDDHDWGGCPSTYEEKEVKIVLPDQRQRKIFFLMILDYKEYSV